jgi:glycosyltransferase involved in cell wall biosynthesis
MTGASSSLVSVGLPTFNRPEGLRRALECLTAQTHRDLEIIVSDNASPDARVQEILHEFAARDSRVKPFRQPTNIGFLPNFRFVFEKATGEYFMWAADDDEWDASFVEVCLNNLLNPEYSAVLSFCHVRKRKSDGAVVDPDYADPISSESSSLLLRAFRYLYYSGGNHCFYGLYRRHYIDDWFFARRFGNDHLALLALLRHGNIHIDKRVLFTSTVGGGGFERQNFHKYYDSTVMKVCVTLSSTLTWWYEFLRCIWITPFRFHEKVILSLFTAARFSRPRYWRRFAGDFVALLTRRDIWNFKSG